MWDFRTEIGVYHTIYQSFYLMFYFLMKISISVLNLQKHIMTLCVY